MDTEGPPPHTATRVSSQVQGRVGKRRDTEEDPGHHLREMNQNSVLSTDGDREQQRKEELQSGRNPRGADQDSRQAISHPTLNMLLRVKGI